MSTSSEAPTTPPEAEAPLTIEKPEATFPYGWEPEPFKKQVEIDGEKQVDIHGNPLMEEIEGLFVKKFNHPFRTIIRGAAKRGPRFANITPTTKRQQLRHSETKPTRYIVMVDHSIRRLDKVLLKAIEQMTPEQQVALVAANAQGEA